MAVEHILTPDSKEETLSFWDKHRLSLLLIITVTFAVALTVISVIIYTASGAAQLDLSRPGYQSVADQVEKETDVLEFSAFGGVDKETIKEFIELYDKQAERVKSVDAFNGDPLNPELLQLAETRDED